MVSLVLRMGSTSADPPPARTVHAFAGECNHRRCSTCGRTPIQAQLLPFAVCAAPAPRLPFDGLVLAPPSRPLATMPAPRRDQALDAVGARVEICLLAIAGGADADVIGQVLAELGDEVRAARAARLPDRADPISVVRTQRQQRARA